MPDEDPRELLKQEIRERIAAADERVHTAFQEGHDFGRGGTPCIVVAGLALIGSAVTGVLAAQDTVDKAWPAGFFALIVVAGAVGRFLSSRQRALYTESNAWRTWSPETRQGLALRARGTAFDYTAAKAWRDERVAKSDAILAHAWGELYGGTTQVYENIEQEARSMQKERVDRPPVADTTPDAADG